MHPDCGPARSSPKSSRPARSGKPNPSTRIICSIIRPGTPATSRGPDGGCRRARRWHRPRADPRSGAHAQARAIALFDAVREPLGGQLARDLRALQRYARQQRARLRRVTGLVSQGEHAQVMFGALEVDALTLFERAADVGIAQVDATPKRAGGTFGRTGLTVVVADQVAVEGERDTCREAD